MALSQSFLDELIYRCDIVDTASAYIRLKKAGANYMGLCPFHNEKTPSFSVSREKQIYKCFGCGEGGNVISFVMKIENLPFVEAVRLLADKVGLTMPEDDFDADAGRKLRERLLALNKAAARFYHDALMADSGAIAREYLHLRGISLASIKRFGLGYADDSWDSLIHAMLAQGFSREELETARLAGRGKSGGLYNFFRSRVMFPVSDLRRNVVAFGGRVLEGDGGGRKYINSADTPVYNKSKVLYGMNLAKSSKAKSFILVEGNMDVIALHQAGFDSAVASCGTAFTADQAKLLGRYTGEVAICFDADSAGQNATQKAIGVLRQAGIEARVLSIPPKRDAAGHVLLGADGRPIKNDPDDYIKENGAQAFARLLERPETDGQFRLGQIKAKYRLEFDEQRIAFTKEAAGYIATIGNAVEREILARSAARDAEVSDSSLLTEISRLRSALIKRSKRREQRAALEPKKAIQPQSRGLRYSNPASAKSEELLLAAVLDDRELLRYAAGKIRPDEFSSDFLAKIYKMALERLESELEATAAACMMGLEEAESAHLASIISSGALAKDGTGQLQDYIDKIKFEAAKQSKDDPSALLRLVNMKKERDKTT